MPANLLQLWTFQNLIWSQMPALGCRMGRKGGETRRCTHTPVLGQPVVPAHEGSGRVNAGEVLPWDTQHLVIFSTVTLRREQTQSETSPRVGFDTKTLISPSSCFRGGCQPFLRAGMLSRAATDNLSSGPSSTLCPCVPEPTSTSLGQAEQAEDGTGGTNPRWAETAIGHHREEVPQPLPLAAAFQRPARAATLWHTLPARLQTSLRSRPEAGKSQTTATRHPGTPHPNPRPGTPVGNDPADPPLRYPPAPRRGTPAAALPPRHPSPR